jgi:uncharacterized membrane protein YgcG
MSIIAGRRNRDLERIRRLIERLHSPRLHMMLIVALTAAVGFLVTVALLHAGIASLWLRYPMAVAVAYLAFLFFLGCWLRLKTTEFLDGLDIPTSGAGSESPNIGEWNLAEKSFEPGGGQFGGGGASASFDEDPGFSHASADVASGSSGEGSGVSDALGAFDLEELALVLLAIGALIATAFAALWIVWIAPAFFAEIMLDAALAAGLYRRLRGVERDHWLRTAVGKTVWPFVGVAVLFSLAGAAMQAYAPGAKSIGEVVRQKKITR